MACGRSSTVSGEISASPRGLEVWISLGVEAQKGPFWLETLHLRFRRWIPSNRTLMRLVVTGPEDPKVMELQGSYVVAFDSQPVKEKGGGNCRRNTKGAAASLSLYTICIIYNMVLIMVYINYILYMLLIINHN